MRRVKDKEECYAAAKALKLIPSPATPWGAHVMRSAREPLGCIYADNTYLAWNSPYTKSKNNPCGFNSGYAPPLVRREACICVNEGKHSNVFNFKYS